MIEGNLEFISRVV